MDNEMMGMFQTIIEKIDSLDKKIEAVDKKVDENHLETKIMIENEVAKRIDSLFDGYQLVHEKQWEMDKKMRELEQRLEKLEALQNVG